MTKIEEKIIDLELEKLIEVLNATQNFRLQVAIFFGTTNVTGIGLGLSTEKSSLIILSASLLLLYVFSDMVTMRTTYGYYYRAIRILKTKLKYEDETIFDMFTLFLRKKKVLRIHKITNYPDQVKRFKALRSLPYYTPTIIGFWVPISIFIIEISFGLHLYNYEDWKLY